VAPHEDENAELAAAFAHYEAGHMAAAIALFREAVRANPNTR
jgi:hypothetical protein